MRGQMKTTAMLRLLRPRLRTVLSLRSARPSLLHLYVIVLSSAFNTRMLSMNHTGCFEVYPRSACSAHTRRSIQHPDKAHRR